MSEFYIDYVCPKDETERHPVIFNFQNGYITDNFKDTECTILRDEITSKRNVALEVCDTLYVGAEEQEELGKTIIMARNKKTGKVRIIEVGTVDLKPYLKVDLDNSQLMETSNLDLSRKFGSKKHKKIMEQREKLKVNVQTVTDQMQNVSQNISEDQLDLSNYNKTDENFYVPPIDREAKSVEQVYDLDKILTEDMFQKVYEEMENTDYMSNFNEFLKTIVSENMPKKHLVLALYANSLLNMYGTLMKDITKKTYVACPHSASLNDHILKNFLSISNNRKLRTPQMKDKSLCHALVFVLLINKYKFNLEDLCKQLKFTSRVVATKVSVTGASIITEGNKKVVQLKLPISKPALRRRSNKF
ncbi:uncharacterized protein LOC114244425 [Bombyx mandarina]|uniref:Uncharacterized protein LOC114244425 n=1 Tax=Bombyx mandarina TaxID=7092 RepID=A0A6J2JQM3_BOMMA|nr:uncharacterized protein LOC114244425 [Bombyx mandarina]